MITEIPGVTPEGFKTFSQPFLKLVEAEQKAGRGRALSRVLAQKMWENELPPLRANAMQALILWLIVYG